MSADEPTPEERSVRGRLGGLTAAARMTPEQRTDRARKANAARWAAVNARRAEQGLPPTRKTEKLLSDEELAYWKTEVDRLFPDRAWKHPADRTRQAIALARAHAARSAAEAFGHREQGDA